ncbi:DUF2723 domain-containing protein [Bacteroidales bacterium]|nr:DUF2723 domain-containing protein [Bacteroidales bacterium]
MQQYKRLNLILGWLSFLIAAVTYLMTIEPTTSLWDCGEFIASAYKLEVGHPPGAPLFMITARFFALFAKDTAHVAMMINAMSGIASAFTILFLFWTISHLAKKILIKTEADYTPTKMWSVMGAAMVGALAYTFSDTFWFSAVEGEVYASSSFFTAIVFWAILKWENEADSRYATRWVIFIAYMVGLSIGVHLLNLLAIPAIVLVIYFRKYEVTTKGTIYTLLISGLILAFLMWGIIPGLISGASKFELLFVNNLGMGFNSGVLVYIVCLVISLIAGIYYTHKQNNHLLVSLFFALSFFFVGAAMIGDNIFLAILLTGGVFTAVYYLGDKYNTILNTILITFTVIIIGYSSFSMIVIRSHANPPMDENNPETVFSLLSYINREQYGDRPLVSGHYYNAPVTGSEKGKPTYSKIGDKYKITNEKISYEYDDRFKTIFPRMYSGQANHIKLYQQYAQIKGRAISVPDGKGGRKKVYKPTMTENLRFFIKYQVGHMYWRYFLWNFAGRQNDIQADGSIVNGNWISGINFFDKSRVGPSDNLPEDVKNHRARNRYFFLPFILGMVGLWWHSTKNKKDFTVVMFLFILTGLAIVVYLNQTPQQPRERDYAYAASFYAFAIWVGLGVLAFIEYLQKSLKGVPAVPIAITLSMLGVPVLMASENWDDHDRSGRYLALAIAQNYLNSCQKNAIMFTNGDNDTFPLWYAQEVEGIRTDVRVCNLMLFNTDWYIEQMARKAYESEALPLSLTREQYIQGTRDAVFIQERTKKTVDVKDVMDFIASDKDKTKVTTRSGDKYDYIPTRTVRLKVDKEAVLRNGIVAEKDTALILDEIVWKLPGSQLMKSEIMVLDILSTYKWDRPLYWVSLHGSGSLGLADYMQLEGYAYKLVPIKTPAKNQLERGRINTDVMYNNIMNKFDYGRMNEDDVHLDHFHLRTLSVIRFRTNFTRLAEELIKEGKKDSAIAVLDKCIELTPHKNVPYDYFTTSIAVQYLKAGEEEKAADLLNKIYQISDDHLDYYLNIDRKYTARAGFAVNMYMHLFQEVMSITSKNDIAGINNEELEQKFRDYYSKYQVLQ